MNPIAAKAKARDAKSRAHAPAIIARAKGPKTGPPAPQPGPKLSSYAHPTPPAKGPGATPAPGQLVREGINYKDLSPDLQSQMAKQAGLVPDAPQLPPGVTTPEQESATEAANEQEGTETTAKADLEVPKGHTAVAAHTRKLPMSKVGRAKLKARGVTPSDE